MVNDFRADFDRDLDNLGTIETCGKTVEKSTSRGVVSSVSGGVLAIGIPFKMMMSLRGGEDEGLKRFPGPGDGPGMVADLT